VDLLVVSKTWPPAVVREVYDAGHDLFGENKVQDALEKIPRLPPGVRWHFIGHLQRNKVRKILPHVEALHGIDSLKLAAFTDRVASELGTRPEVYLEVNLGEEPSKNGFIPGVLRESAEDLLRLEHLEVVGLMCIPPASPEAGQTRGWFAQLRELRDEIECRHGVRLPKLSMGMSHDYEVAIEEGSTIVRVGTAIFGSRMPGKPAGNGAGDSTR
jgi:pyridoxal phosphate enzyme (YggS family)